jgi:hypothetical protein
MKPTASISEKSAIEVKIPTNGDSGKTKIELRQAIANLSRQNIGGVYNERIAAYQSELARKEAIKCNTIHTVVKHSDIEVAAIMAFNSDKRFSITE